MSELEPCLLVPELGHVLEDHDHARPVVLPRQRRQRDLEDSLQVGEAPFVDERLTRAEGFRDRI